MLSKNFIEVQGQTIRIADISLISDIISVQKKNKKGKKVFSHFTFTIMLNNGHTINIERKNELDIMEDIEPILKVIS